MILWDRPKSQLSSIYYIVEVSTDRFKHPIADTENSIISSITVNDDIALLLDGKNQQLANQLIYESVARFTPEHGQKDRKVTEDIPDELLAEDRSRRLYGTSSY